MLRGRWSGLIVILASSLGAFVVLILWLENAQGITRNGVFKAVTIKGCITNSRVKNTRQPTAQTSSRDGTNSRQVIESEW